MDFSILDELVDGNSNGSRKFKRFDQSEIAIRSSEENTDGKTLNTTTLEALLKEIQKVKAFTVITKSPNETIDGKPNVRIILTLDNLLPSLIGLPTVTDASLVDSMENRANFEEIVDSVGLTPDEPETTERLDEDSTELVSSTDENLEDSTVYDVDLRFANNITDPINENDANSTNITDDGIVTTTEQLVSVTDKLESRQGNIESVNIEKIENSTESNKSTTVTESTTPPTPVFPTTVIVPVQEIRIAKTAEELINAQASLLKSSSTEQPTTETVATVTARKMNIKREIEYRHDGPMRKFKRKRQDQDVIVRPAPRRMTLKERLENETSVERAERVNRALQKMMQFASIVGQVDSYITGRIRTSVKKLARMYDEDEREARNRRSSF